MDDLDRFIESQPAQAIMAGTIIKVLMPAEERLKLARGLEREPDYKDCLWFSYEKKKHEDFLRAQKRQELQQQELKDKEVIRRLVWEIDSDR